MSSRRTDAESRRCHRRRCHAGAIGSHCPQCRTPGPDGGAGRAVRGRRTRSAARPVRFRSRRRPLLEHGRDRPPAGSAAASHARGHRRTEPAATGIAAPCRQRVRIGGRVLYSTCSIESEEDEEAVARFRPSGRRFVLSRMCCCSPVRRPTAGISAARAYFVKSRARSKRPTRSRLLRARLFDILNA